MTKLLRSLIHRWNAMPLAWAACGALGLAVAAFAQERPAIPHSPAAPPQPKHLSIPQTPTGKSSPGSLTPLPKTTEGFGDAPISELAPAGPHPAPLRQSGKGVVVFTEVPAEPDALPAVSPATRPAVVEPVAIPPAAPEIPAIPMPAAPAIYLPAIPQVKEDSKRAPAPIAQPPVDPLAAIPPIPQPPAPVSVATPAFELPAPPPLPVPVPEVPPAAPSPPPAVPTATEAPLPPPAPSPVAAPSPAPFIAEQELPPLPEPPASPPAALAVPLIPEPNALPEIVQPPAMVSPIAKAKLAPKASPTAPPLVTAKQADIRPLAFQEPKLPEKVKADPVEVAPAPRPLELFGGNHPRLQRLPGAPGPLGTTPVPSKKDLEEYNRYVKEFVDPRNTLDLVQGRTRLMVLSEVPKRIQVGNESIAIYNLVTPKEITVLGKQVGTTILNLWFTDPEHKDREKILSYLVRVIPDPEEKERLDNVYKALQDEINRTFPDSLVHLKLVGDKLVVSGQVHDITQATHILNIVKANAPGGNQGKESLDPAKIPVGREPTVRPGDPGNVSGTAGLEDFQLLGGPNVINLLRIPGEQQVMLRVTVAEVNRSAARSIGLNFAVNNSAGSTVFQNRTGNIGTGGPLASFGFGGLTTATGLASNFAGLSTNNLPISLDGGQVSLAINALRNISYARSLAEPNLVAMNGQSATFHAGGQFPVPVVTGNTFSGLQGANFVPYGVNLQFTPFVLDRDRIRLNVAATVSTRDLTTGSSIGGSFVSGLSSRNFQTTVELREGQTLAVAGLIQNNLGTDATRVPWFGDIPILSRLAGFDRTSSGEQEVVVLITPELVHPMNGKEAAAMPLPGADLFEPSDLEFYLLGRLESRRSYDYRSPVMNDWDRMRSYKQCEQTYIFGPSGYGN
ncbi:MAG: pilus assembly protein N-terminal domain-containing protein [Gemmataceae bacterium]|nr:pilus assembly protein N-terminal domain-containing protein [Gemmataceae bacterium]